MKVVVAVDSFKGCIRSLEAGNAVKQAILDVDPQAEVLVSPLADGGEGTTQTLIEGLGGTLVSMRVSGPLGESVECSYGISADQTAVIEMAACAGLTLIPPEKRDPLQTTTYGLGEILLDALERGCRNFIIGIGGSATNDLGMGMLSALGVRFLNENGALLKPCGACLGKIQQIDLSGMEPRIAQCCFQIACDVRNPLLGPNGCAVVFSPQKGASSQTVDLLESGARHYADLVAKVLGKDFRDCPGAGAAGGLGYAFITFFPAELRSGVEIVLQETKLEQKLRDADLFITGEGKIDAQTSMGKAPVGAARLARKACVPTVAFCGCVAEGAEMCNLDAIDAFFPILRSPCSLEDAMDSQKTLSNLYAATKQVFLLVKAVNRNRLSY